VGPFYSKEAEMSFFGELDQFISGLDEPQQSRVREAAERQLQETVEEYEARIAWLDRILAHNRAKEGRRLAELERRAANGDFRAGRILEEEAKWALS